MRITLECPVPDDYLSWPLHERACLLVGSSCSRSIRVRGFVPVPNVADDRRNDFAVSARSYRAVARRYGPVIGVVHSHLPNMNEWPSDNDLRGLPEGWIGAVYHPHYEHMWWYRRGEALDLVVRRPPLRSAA